MSNDNDNKNTNQKHSMAASAEDDGSLDITDLDRLELVQELWYSAPTAAFYYYHPVVPPKFDSKEAVHILEHINGNFDYLCGRPIKTTLSNLMTRHAQGGYDRNQPSRTFKQIVDDMRAGKKLFK